MNEITPFEDLQKGDIVFFSGSFIACIISDMHRVSGQFPGRNYDSYQIWLVNDNSFITLYRHSYESHETSFPPHLYPACFVLRNGEKR